MDKTHYKELIEKYFEETITDVEIKELSDWIKNDRTPGFPRRMLSSIVP